MKTTLITGTSSGLGKKLCNSVLMNYTPTRPIKFINVEEPINFDF